MDARLHYRLTVGPVLHWLQTLNVKSDRRAAVLLLAIAGQECGYCARFQIPVAHARGLYQFEKGGGVRGVLRHPSTATLAKKVCEALIVEHTEDGVYVALGQNDALSCSFARLLLFTDAQPLPDDMAGGWAYYLRCWRPGKPHPASWARAWNNAVAAADGGPPGGAPEPPAAQLLS